MEPGLDALGEAVRRGLAGAGALVVLDNSGSADSDLAGSANSFEADVAIALRTGDLPGHRCSFFATRSFRSEAGLILATRVEDELGGVLGESGPPAGKTYAVLRETRMPAIVCAPVCAGDVDGMRAVVGAAASVADAIVRGVRSWAEAPLDARC
ncbi:MAG: N-acetylmuramoyl-L-alanine amidase [Acidimicrobiia bacterium]|nr:N-acetylmuramoyl-L-alanine amidase [Acidimicrobiia bacterium]